MLRSAASRAVWAAPSPLPGSGAASFSVLGVKDAAAAAAIKLKQTVAGAQGGGASRRAAAAAAGRKVGGGACSVCSAPCSGMLMLSCTLLLAEARESGTSPSAPEEGARAVGPAAAGESGSAGGAGHVWPAQGAAIIAPEADLLWRTCRNQALAPQPYCPQTPAAVQKALLATRCPLPTMESACSQAVSGVVH